MYDVVIHVKSLRSEIGKSKPHHDCKFDKLELDLPLKATVGPI